MRSIHQESRSISNLSVLELTDLVQKTAEYPFLLLCVGAELLSRQQQTDKDPSSAASIANLAETVESLYERQVRSYSAPTHELPARTTETLNTVQAFLGQVGWSDGLPMEIPKPITEEADAASEAQQPAA